MKTEELIAKLSELIRQQTMNFLEMGRVLCQLEDRIKLTDLEEVKIIGYRHARYLIAISKYADQLQLADEIICTIGWSKMALIARHIPPDQAGEWILKAQYLSYALMKAEIEGVEPNDGQCLYKFKRDQQTVVDRVLLRYGANRRGRGLANKEDALIRALLRLEQLEDLTPKTNKAA